MKKIIEKIKAWLLAVPARDLWFCLLGMALCSTLGILLPAFAEWPIVPLLFVAFLVYFFANKSGRFDWGLVWFIGGALFPQILFWIA